MNRVGKFEKVSFEQFLSAMKAIPNVNQSEFFDNAVLAMYENLELPTRATFGSAGYDFRAPFAFDLDDGQSITIPTGVRVKIDEGWWLACIPRSSLGFKYRLQLDNSIGCIDSDYYYSDNEGHIFAKLTKDKRDCKLLHINAGDRFMQGIFLPYGVIYGDDAKAARNGGMGSTGG